MSAPAERVGSTEFLARFIGGSPQILGMLDMARKFAPTRIPVLIVGATGTGKELLAHHIHLWSRRAGEPVDVNCGALPRELVESTLFGSIRGAFSGSMVDREGLIEAADGTTLFLDEICSLPLDAQVKLLRVLDTSQVRRVGEVQKRRVDFRLICASQEHLGDRAAAGTFRLDLLQRIAGIVLELPPLTERRSDIMPMAVAFAAELGFGLAAEMEEALRGHNWPGNVRELKKVIERACWISEEVVVTPTSVESAMRLEALTASGAAVPGPAAERALLLAVCEEEEWHSIRIAKRFGIGRTTLYRRLLEAGLFLRERKRLFRLTQASRTTN